MKKRKKRSSRSRSGRGARGLPEVEGDRERIRCLTEQLEREIGKPTQVFHEKRSELVHVDVHVIPPRTTYPFITLFTTGMSERPMPAAPRCGCCPTRAELMMTLPATWSLPRASCCDRGRRSPWPGERPGADPLWPVRLLRDLARYPHRAGTWLGWGHTVAEGDPPMPYARDTGFCGVALFPSLLAPRTVRDLTGPDGEPIELFALYPLYPEEVDLKLRLGPRALLRCLEAHRVNELVEERVNVGRSSSWWTEPARLPR
jgi:hypothetical protein